MKKVIDKYDIFNLLAVGAPSNEYDHESKDIASKINEESSIDEIANICADVFTHWFGVNFSKEIFLEVAIEIKSSIY